MRYVYRVLRTYLQENFHPRLYLAMAGLLVVCLVFNYSLDFEDTYLDPMAQPYRGLMIWAYHTLPYLASCSLIVAFGEAPPVFRRSEFWLKVCFGFGLLALARTYRFLPEWIDTLDTANRYFVFKNVNLIKDVAIVVGGILVFYFAYDRRRLEEKHGYGLWLKQFDPKPYFVLLGITAVIIGLGSFLGEIQEYYPRYKRSGGAHFAAYNDLPEWVAVVFYQISYGLNFISVEAFFRGFLILAFARLLGPQVVLPMVVTYCVLHFGKPLGESISSIFGGWVLGVITLSSRKIWGGVMIHVGIAWLMELFGWLQS